MKLKELLTQMYEGKCERLPDETDEDYLTRCSNSVFNLPGTTSQRSNLPNAMKKKIVIPIPIKTNEADTPSTGERIQNLNNRIKVLRDKISATKSPEQKKLHSDRLKNALQSLSNIRRDHSIKK
jgi:hypothetical protein